MQQEATEGTGNGLIESLGAAGASVRGLVGDILELVAVETRSAGIAVAAIFAIGLGVLFSVMVAWLMIWAALGVWLAQAGLGLQWAFLVIALVNILIAIGLVFLILRFSQRLKFSATRKALSLVPTTPKAGMPPV